MFSVLEKILKDKGTSKNLRKFILESQEIPLVLGDKKNGYRIQDNRQHKKGH